MTSRVTAVKEAMDQLIREMNVMGGEEDMVQGMTESLQGQHRTLQQTFFRVFSESMKEYQHTGTDLRNEAAVNYAKHITKIEYQFPFI